MIYLIKTAVFVEGDDNTGRNDSAILALKIGYSNDDRGNGRFADYRANGFDIRVIRSIPGGSYLLENRIHRYFKKYNIPSRSREWFYCKDEIIDLFLNCQDILDLYKLFDADGDDDLRQQDYDSMSDGYKINKDLCDNIRKFAEEHPEDLSGNVYSFLIKLQRLTTFPKRLRLICNNDLDDNDLSVLLQYLPQKFVDYFLILGPDTCKSFSYFKCRLDREYNKRVNNQEIDSSERILETFKVGEKYTLSFIKNTLREIYSSLGLKRTPLATDLEEIYLTKRVKFMVGDKRENGYQILSINPQFPQAPLGTNNK